MRKQDHQTAKPRSLLKRRRFMQMIFGNFDQNHDLENAIFSTIVKYHFYRLKSLLFRRHQTTKPMSILQKSWLEGYLKFLKNHGLTLLEICKFFDYSKMTFLSSKKPPFEKTTSSNDKTNVYFTEKLARRILEIFDESWFNPFGNRQIFRLQ